VKAFPALVLQKVAKSGEKVVQGYLKNWCKKLVQGYFEWPVQALV
jgi:hypothetical protein